ncbi:NlpC/P60 family protein [Streptomyces sp. NPDC057411]|uniref:NlpC/P60 family protein n=1 Tax=unclassified Streptomyces TaxID=2593676 RepID=UPI0036428407
MSAPKFSPSRRSALLAFAGVAASGALPLAAATPAVAATTSTPTDTLPSTPSALPAGLDPRLPIQMDPTDAWHFAPPTAGPLTTRAIPGGLEVKDDRGVLATLTTGAKTVTLRGPKRWFTEQKKPVVDAFNRTPPTGGWGMSPGGGTWTHHNGADSAYVVENGQGVIKFAVADAGKSRYSLLSDYAIGDVSVRARFSFEKRPTGAAVSLGLVVAAENVNNHYRARLILTPAGDVQFVLEKELLDESTTLSSAVTLASGYTAGERWWVRVEKTGNLLRARAWKDGTGATEPETWTHTFYDLEKDPLKLFPKGAVGVRGLASQGTTATASARVDEFRIEKAVWPDPPVVTHDTWVRVLPEPFAGSWTPAVEQQIRAWAGDTSPDVLTYSSMFRAFAPAITDPARGGAQVLGESGYSAADPVTGLRNVGPDFHEYMGIDNWPFPNGEVGTLEQEGRYLDCSGFVRMVYGYHMGIPMVLEKDFVNGNLPRKSKDQASSGPGVKIADGGVGTIPPLDGLRIGDAVFFDTDETSDAGGHIGIYMGLDLNGHRRFVSSRKTPNGPTLSDLGGKSILDGELNTYDANHNLVKKGDLYTNTLRVIRRF